MTGSHESLRSIINRYHDGDSDTRVLVKILVSVRMLFPVIGSP